MIIFDRVFELLKPFYTKIVVAIIILFLGLIAGKLIGRLIKKVLLEVELNNIVKRYHKLKKSESSFVLNGVNLIVERGKVTSIIGSNGAGKTTLFNIINGFTDADSGSICYYDKTGIKKYLLKT